MNPEANPYTPGAGASPPALVGRDREVDEFGVGALVPFRTSLVPFRTSRLVRGPGRFRFQHKRV